MHIVLPAVPPHNILAVRRKVVQYQMNTLPNRIPFAKKPQDPKRFLVSFSAADISPQLVAMNIVKRQPMPHAIWSCVCRSQANWFATPALTGLRTNLQRPELVEGDRWAICRRIPFVFANPFFLDLRCVSLHSFHVFVRRSRILRPRRICRSVSKLTDLIIFSSMRYSRSLAKDHRLNGLPSRSGGHRAVSIIILFCSSLNFSGLPIPYFGSRAAMPSSLNCPMMLRTCWTEK